MEISAPTRTTGRAVMRVQATWLPYSHRGGLQSRIVRPGPLPRQFAEILFPFHDLGIQSFSLLRDLYEGEGPPPHVVEIDPPVTVLQIRYASPLQLVLDVSPLWATPGAIAVLVVLVRVSVGIDLDLRTVRTQKKAELLEAQMRLEELERDQRRLARIEEEPVAFSRTHWIVDKVDLMDEDDEDLHR